MSPNLPQSGAGTPGPDQNRTNNLLNLLKFNNQSAEQNQSGALANLQNISAGRSPSVNTLPNSQASGAGQPRAVSASDLVASFQRKPSDYGMAPSPLASAAERPEAKIEGPTSPPGNPQDFLLNLLKRPADAQGVKSQAVGSVSARRLQESESTTASVDKLAQSFADASIGADQPKPTTEQARVEREPTPVRLFGSTDATSTPFEAPQPTKASMFSYVNPFDQLSASSPAKRTRTPQPTEPQAQPKKMEILKHERDISSSINGDSAQPAQKSRKLTSVEPSPAPSPLPDGRSPLEAMMGIGSDGKSKSVSQALSGVGEKVDKQVEQALAEADAQEKGATSSKVSETIEKTADGTAFTDAKVKNELEGEDDIADSWESADAAEEDLVVEVYNLPMKPFVSIHIKKRDAPPGFRQDTFMVIAQLKKEFDQIDRTLATASRTHIVYAQVGTKRDNGGFRVIRQDTGQHKQVFKSSGERIFNVQICAANGANDVESILATGVNGTIYWTGLSKSRDDMFDEDDFEAQGFIMPPVTTAEENTSGSPVKTRAKMSSRHPEFFGVARGKQIHIISPFTARSDAYRNSKTHVVDSEKYLEERGLKILTGKAGKDFCFSEDDTVLVSLDKNGRIKFWDIKEICDLASDNMLGRREAVELRSEIWGLKVASAGEKYHGEKTTVSSVMFVDKERPTAKGVALRYMIIGLQQNHILQLWDLGLGKQVQELHFPHEKDSDAICSISYHAKSGIIALGHPTRNSVYFIHLSAPKYHIPHMDQARYINLLAREDAGLPRPESTAIMSGLREFSFASKGQLRSVDMLKSPLTSETGASPEAEVLFELYVMHSKGVVGLSIKRDDLGWDAAGKVIKPVDALSAGVVEIGEIGRVVATTAGSEKSSSTEATPKASARPAEQPVAKPSPSPKKVEVAKAAPSPKPEVAPSPVRAVNGANKPEAKKEKGSMQVPEAPAPSQPAPVNPTLITPDSYAMAAQRAKSPTPASKPSAAISKAPESNAGLGPGVSEFITNILSRELISLYQRIDSDKRVQEAAAAAKQDAVLRLVSSTLTENVEKTLSRIIGAGIQQEVIPAISDVASKAVDLKLAEVLTQQLTLSVPKEVKAVLPGAVTHALKDHEVQRTISEMTANKVSHAVQQHVNIALQSNIPNISNLAMQATQKMVADVERRTTEQLRQAEVQRQNDHTKIDQLTNLVRSLSETIHGMAEGQSAFQEQILRMQRPASRSAQGGTSSVAADPELSPEDEEVQMITQLMTEGKYEEGTIQWLQSSRQGELFDRLFVRCNPQYLRKLTPLVTLSVSAAITASFDSYVDERLEWLSIVLQNINLHVSETKGIASWTHTNAKDQDEDIVDVAPKIMDVLSQRLQGAYMQIAEANPGNPALKKLSALARNVAEVKRMTG